MTTTLSQTGSEIQVDLNAVEAGNIGKTAITDLTDTTVAAAKKSGYHSLQASSQNAPSADRSVIVSAVRNTAASGELRYGQVLLSESNKLYWNTDDGGVLGTWREAVSTAGGQTLTNKSITGGSLAINTISEESSGAGVTIDSVLLKDNTVLAGTLTAGAGLITDSSGAISFGNENLSTTGTLSVGGTLGVTGVLTGTSLDISGDIDVDGTTNLDIVDIDGAVNMATTALVTGVLTTTATQVATGGITSGSNIVSDTDSTDDLGTTSVRWANLFVDSITTTDQITATGFTGTLDGILGSGAAAAATVTTLDTSGAVNLNLITDSSSSTSGALIVDGGVGIAKKLYVGTDLDVDGTTNLDVVDIDGAVDIATTALVTGVLTTTATQVATGGITSGSDIISDTDSTDSLGSTAVRWLKGWFDTLTAGTLTIGSGSVTDSSGAISFGNENLSTTGTLASGNLAVTGTTTGSGYLYLSSKTANQGLRLNNTTKIQSWNPAGNVLRDLMELDANEDVRIGSSANDIYLDNDTTVTGTLDVSGATTLTAATAINANVANPLTINATLDSIAYSEIFNISTGASAAAYFGIVTQNLANSGTIRSGMFFDSSNHLNLINGEAGGAGIVLDDNNAVTMSGNLTVAGKYNITRGDITIATGAITPTTSYVRLDTQASAATDDLDTINGGVIGDIVILETRISSRDVVVKDGTGNLGLAGGADFTLVNKSSTITLIYDGTSWLEMSRSSN